MTITVLQATGVTDDSSSYTVSTGSNVTANTLVIVGIALYSPVSTALADGDCTKSAGTATLGTISLAVARAAHPSSHGAGERVMAAIWSAIVTGSGSLTMAVTRASGAAGPIAVIEASSDVGWDASRLEDSDSAVVEDAAGSGTAASPSMDSAGKAIFVGAFAPSQWNASAETTAGGAATTEVAEEENGNAHMTGAVSYGIKSGAASGAVSWTYDTSYSQGWAVVGAVFKEAAGGSTKAPPPWRKHTRFFVGRSGLIIPALAPLVQCRELNDNVIRRAAA